MISMIDISIDKRCFNKEYLFLLNDETPYQIFYGGSSSGKSFFMAQRCVIDICNGGRNYLIVRKTKNSIKKSIFNEIKKAISRFKLNSLFTVNATDGTITCINGFQILFSGLDDTEKIKGVTPINGVITDIWIEEATESDYEDFKQLDKRLRGKTAADISKRLIMTFNPILQSHWIYKMFFGKWQDDKDLFRDGNTLIYKTTYKNNEFLTEQDRHKLENEPDVYYYNVYTLGNWGVLGEAIFKNWTVEDLSEKRNTFDRFLNGLDFGFSKDQTAFVRMHYDRKNGTLYILDEIYETELTNDILAERLKKLIEHEYVTCDSASPQNIRELQLLGIHTLAAKKPKGSVNYGYQWLRRQKIVINATCVNVKREFELAQWKKDKHGNVLSVPIDRDNHAIDAIRYGCEDMMVEEQDAILF